jgi:hypothetical protein
MKRVIMIKSDKIFEIVIIVAAVILFFVVFLQKPATIVAGAVIDSDSSMDTYSDTQWYVNNPGFYMGYALGVGEKLNSVKGIDMNVTKAWDHIKKTGVFNREVVVAVIDTGVDYSHPDLSGHIWFNKGEVEGDHIDNDNNGYIDDYYGWDFYHDDASVCHYEKGTKIALTNDSDNHGTHIAGIIAAVADNKIGIAGVASNINIKIMILKINGGKDDEGKMSDAIEAIKYAEMMGADICNLSWGTTEYSDELYETMKESDMLFVAVAGNGGDDNDITPLYPGNFELDNLISVTSINAEGEMPFFSNYGAKTVDIAAPGNDIYSTIVGGGYGTMSGSSVAVPQVTAIAALMYAYGNHIYASNVRDIIFQNLKLLPSLEGMMIYPGIPDAYLCVNAAEDLMQDNIAPTLSFKTIYYKNVMTIPVQAEDSGGSQIRMVKWIFGNKKVEDFKHGTEGTLVEAEKVDLSVAGTYTFYTSDYAGNETAVAYEVVADEEAPKLKVSYTISDDYKTRTVTIKASDSQSGIKRVEYMAGVKKTKEFLPADAGTKISIKGGKATFTAKKDGAYTVFISDYRGNMTVKTITVKTVKATKFRFSQPIKLMTVGEEYYLKAVITPKDSTDKIIYSSQNEQIAEVSSTGTVTAIANGTVCITAKTSSGKITICIITVNSDA